MILSRFNEDPPHRVGSYDAPNTSRRVYFTVRKGVIIARDSDQAEKKGVPSRPPITVGLKQVPLISPSVPLLLQKESSGPSSRRPQAFIAFVIMRDG